jgi:hypothetical protein
MARFQMFALHLNLQDSKEISISEVFLCFFPTAEEVLSVSEGKKGHIKALNSSRDIIVENLCELSSFISFLAVNSLRKMTREKTERKLFYNLELMIKGEDVCEEKQTRGRINNSSSHSCLIHISKCWMKFKIHLPRGDRDRS